MRINILIFLTLMVFHGHCAVAASRLAYSVSGNGHKANQMVNLQEDLAWISGAGGDPELDVLFRQTSHELILIDHRRQQLTVINDKTLSTISRQIEDMTPVLRGLSNQIRHLNPRQRAKWEKMLGDFPLDEFDAIQVDMKKTRVEVIGSAGSIAGIPCQLLRLHAGSLADVELCLAQPGALGVDPEDSASLQAISALFRQFLHKLLGSGRQLGLTLDEATMDALSGIPLLVKELKGRHPTTVKLDHIESKLPALKPVEIPTHYRTEPLRLW